MKDRAAYRQGKSFAGGKSIMVSINTNLQSLMVQSNLSKSTNALNNAIEKMTTGYKINHASDNAANYSISNSYSSKLSSYSVAQENIASGLDLLSVAQDTISLMQNHGSRLHALITQARNGTYGAQSIEALTQEAGALVAEINRLYMNTEYNGINLFEGANISHTALPDGTVLDLTPKYNGFIENPTTHSQSEVDALTHVSELDSFTSGRKYQVSTKDDLLKLAELVNEGADTTNVTFVMGADIDLNSIGNFEQIGGFTGLNRPFKGTFDGNGHVIKNLKMNNVEPERYQYGLFGETSNTSLIKNVGIVDADVKGGECSGILVGDSHGIVQNCYSTGIIDNITTYADVGGLIGICSNDVSNCYSTADVVTTNGFGAGGMIGNHSSGIISNCFAAGNISGKNVCGGFVGESFTTSGKIINCYSTGNVTGQSDVGGFVGSVDGEIFENVYSAGNVSGNNYVGGFAGTIVQDFDTNISNAAEFGTVNGGSYEGSFVGVIKNWGDAVDYIYFSQLKTANNDLNKIGGVVMYDSGLEVDADLTTLENSIKVNIAENFNTTLQVGINSGESSRISFETSLSVNLDSILSDISGDGAYNTINNFLNTLSDKATQLGAASNRLESALESTAVDIDNLTSSLSTIKDADIAKVSSDYIRHQILQQASATLLSTANQSSAFVLQLIRGV